MELVKKGDRVSLNIVKRRVYMQGEGGINLTMGGNKSEIIPDSISEELLKKINFAIKFEYLVKGWTPGEKVDIPEDKDIGDILQKGRNKIKDFLYELKNDTTLSSEKKITKMEKLLELEKAGKNQSETPRVSVTEEIEKTLSSMAGISKVTEEKEEKIEIQLTKGTKEKNS